MSNYNYTSLCPNCGKQMQSCQETKPFEYIYHSCDHCGLQVGANISLRSKEQVLEEIQDPDANKKDFAKYALKITSAKYKKNKKRVEGWDFYDKDGWLRCVPKKERKRK